MNCAVCGGPLRLGRAIFHCSCGVFVHAYCWEQHVLQAHQPPFETGIVDLNGQFRASAGEAGQASETEQAAKTEQAAEIEQTPAEQISSSDE